jgi:hypothetical protein
LTLGRLCRPGWTLISPEGNTLRSYGEPNAIQMTFSADSKRLYGIRVEPDRRTLFLLDIATKEVKTIGEISKDFTPSSYNNPGVRLSRGGWTKYGRCCPNSQALLVAFWEMGLASRWSAPPDATGRPRFILALVVELRIPVRAAAFRRQI